MGLDIVRIRTRIACHILQCCIYKGCLQSRSNTHASLYLIDLPIPIPNPGCKINMDGYCFVQVRTFSRKPPERRRVRRWPINGRPPGGQGIFCNGDSLSSTNLYSIHKMGSTNIHRRIYFQLQKLINVSKIILSKMYLEI